MLSFQLISHRWRKSDLVPWISSLFAEPFVAYVTNATKRKVNLLGIFTSHMYLVKKKIKINKKKILEDH